MPGKPPRRRPGDGSGGGQDPPWQDEDSSRDTDSLDISEMVTAYLVPPEPLRGIRASRAEQLVAHQAAVDHLREQQAALVREVVDWQNTLYTEPAASDYRAEMQLQIDNLWAMWSELERQAAAHRRAIRTLREPDPPPPPEEQGR
jgi:hypothetical protein